MENIPMLDRLREAVDALARKMEAGDAEPIFPADAPPARMADVVLDVLMSNSGMDHADVEALLNVAAWIIVQGRCSHGRN